MQRHTYTWNILIYFLTTTTEREREGEREREDLWLRDLAKSIAILNIFLNCCENFDINL